MAIITGRTEFARRVKALGLTLVQVADLTGYSLSLLWEVSRGGRPMTKRLDIALKGIEQAYKTWLAINGRDDASGARVVWAAECGHRERKVEQ